MNARRVLFDESWWPQRVQHYKGNIESAPVRDVNLESTRALAGTFQSPKLGRLVQYESAMEAAFFQAIEDVDDVVAYLEQPLAIPYQFDGWTRRYIPDALVQFSDGRLCLVEIKPKTELALAQNLHKWASAWEFCTKVGIGFLATDGRYTVRRFLEPSSDSGAEKAVVKAAQSGTVGWWRYRSLAPDLGVADLISLVLRHRLEFRLAPFRLARMEAADADRIATLLDLMEAR